MHYLKYTCFYSIFMWFTFNISAQCSFKYISNDTIFQDYIDFVYSRKNVDEIITIGSNSVRGTINDTLFNAPFIKNFDYCGNILNKIIYKNIGKFRLKHSVLPTHNVYKEEPIGNNTIAYNDNEFILADKAVDTVLLRSVLILFSINSNGDLISYKTLVLNNNEANQTTIKNVLKLENGNVLVVLWDYLETYNFYYFNENLDLINSKSINLARGIRSIKEVAKKEYICTSLSYDNSSFQFYKLDSNGEVNWIVTPDIGFGSARSLDIVNSKIYISGERDFFGEILIYDINSSIFKEFKFDTFYCQQRFCTLNVRSENSLIVGGYIQHCNSNDSSGSDIVIIEIDSFGQIVWNSIYDFRNKLGTSDDRGHYNDYGGFLLSIANDGGAITNGMSRYSRQILGGVSHEDALLIKTEPFSTTSISQIKIVNSEFELVSNLIDYDLKLKGFVELIRNWNVFSINGEEVAKGSNWFKSLNVTNLKSGLYVLKIKDKYNHHYFYKFVKI